MGPVPARQRTRGWPPAGQRFRISRDLHSPDNGGPGVLYPALTLSRPHFFTYGFGFFLQDYALATSWRCTPASIDGMCALIRASVPERAAWDLRARECRSRRAAPRADVQGDRSLARHGLARLEHGAPRPDRERAQPDGGGQSSGRRNGHDCAALASAPDVRRNVPRLGVRRCHRHLDGWWGLHVGYLSGEASLTHQRYDGFRAHDAQPKDLNRMVVTFQPDGSGGLRALRAFGITFLRVAVPAAAPAHAAVAGTDTARRSSR